MSVRIDCTGAAVSTVHATAEAEEAALHRIAAALFEPVELPDGCPGLEARILAAIEELARERTEARTMAHEMAMEVDRLTREEAADAECEERPEATEATPRVMYHMVVRDERRGPETADLATVLAAVRALDVRCVTTSGSAIAAAIGCDASAVRAPLAALERAGLIVYVAPCPEQAPEWRPVASRLHEPAPGDYLVSVESIDDRPDRVSTDSVVVLALPASASTGVRR